MQKIRGNFYEETRRFLQEKSMVAMWKLPFQSTIYVLFSKTAQTPETVNLEQSIPGFLITPFAPSAPKHFLIADEIYTTELSDVLATPPIASLRELFYYKSPTFGTQKDYTVLASDGIAYLQSESMDKIVLSTFRDVATKADPLACFLAGARQAHAMAMLVSTPAVGTWVAASPEKLLSVDRRGILNTMSLASTQAAHDGDDERAVTWTQKEIEEQALVSRYIINCFKKLRLREFEETGPRTVRAGSLFHLRTDFAADLNAIQHPALASSLLKLLHPTSAVCGMPLDKAYAYILAHEGYPREFYTGYLGPVHVNSEIHLYVNLRCIQIHAHSVRCYGGAGLTIHSQSKKENEEVRMKLQSLDQFIVC